MLKKLYILFFLLLFTAIDAFCQSEFDVRVRPLTPAVPNTSDHKVQNKADTSGGIKLSISILEGKIPGISVANALAFPIFYKMKPGDFEDKMGWAFGDYDPCMYRKGISIDKGLVNTHLCQNLDDIISYNDFGKAENKFAALDSVIKNNIHNKGNIIADIIAPQAYAQIGINCEEIYDNFLNGKNNSEEDALNLDACRYHCKTPMVVNAKYTEVCGVNECLEKYRNGVIPQWCSFLAQNLNSGFGVSSPLAPIHEKMIKKSGKKKFFGSCIDNWVNSKTASDECCVYSRKMIQYDEKTGKEFSDFCSVKKSLQLCMDEYNIKKNIHPSCCNMADYYSGALNVPGIKGDLKMEVTMGKEINSYCKNYSKDKYSYYNNCVAEYKKSSGKNIIEDCCKAYALGILAPSLDGVNYSSVVSFCKPK